MRHNKGRARRALVFVSGALGYFTHTSTWDVVYVADLGTEKVVTWSFPHVRPASAQFRPEGRARSKPAEARPSSPTTKPRQSNTTRTSDGERDPALSDSKKTALIERSYALLFELPGQAYPLDRLIEAYQKESGSLDALRQRLQTTLEGGDRTQRYAAHLALARLSERGGNLQAAETALLEAEAIAGDRPEAPLLRAEFAESRGDSARAIVAYEQASLALSAENRARIVIKLRDLELARGNVEQASLRQKELVRLSTPNIYRELELARLLSERGLFDQARTELEEIIKKQRPRTVALATALLELARAELGAREFERASRTLEKAAAQGSNDSGLKLEIAMARLAVARQAGRLAEVVADLEKENEGALLARAAEAREELGQLDAAVTNYQRALQLSPRNSDFLWALARLEEARGRLTEARDVYHRIILSAPRDMRARLAHLDTLLALGERAQAFQALDRAIGDATNVEETLQLLSVCERLDDKARQTRLIEQAIARARDADTLFELGSRIYARGDEQRALTLWERAQHASSSPALGMSRYGEILLDHDKIPEAHRAFSEAVRIDEGSMKIRRSKALALERMATSARDAEALLYREEALADWRVLLTTSDRSDRALEEAVRHVVRLWQRLGRLDQEVSELERRVTMGDRQLHLALLLTEAYELKGQMKRAATVLTRALETAPESPLLLGRRIRLESKGGSFTDLEQPLERLMIVDPKRAKEQLRELAQLARDKGHYQKALEYTERRLSIDPSNVAALVESAEQNALFGRRDQAIARYRQAAALDPNHSQARFELARLLVLQNTPLEAMKLYARVVRESKNAQEIASSVSSALALHNGAPPALSGATWSKSQTAPVLEEMERTLSQLAIGRPLEPVYRAQLLSLYDQLLREHEGRTGSRATAQKELALRSMGPLGHLLRQGTGAEQAKAVELLALSETTESARPLLDYALSGAPLERRLLALEAVGKLEVDDPAIETGLRSFLQENDAHPPSLIMVATWALGRLPQGSGQRGLALATKHAHPGVRTWAWLGLAAFGNFEALMQELTENKPRPPAERAALLLAAAKASAQNVPLVPQTLELAQTAWHSGASAPRAAALFLFLELWRSNSSVATAPPASGSHAPTSRLPREQFMKLAPLLAEALLSKDILLGELAHRALARSAPIPDYPWLPPDLNGGKLEATGALDRLLFISSVGPSSFDAPTYAHRLEQLGPELERCAKQMMDSEDGLLTVLRYLARDEGAPPPFRETLGPSLRATLEAQLDAKEPAVRKAVYQALPSTHWDGFEPLARRGLSEQDPGVYAELVAWLLSIDEERADTLLLDGYRVNPDWVERRILVEQVSQRVTPRRGVLRQILSLATKDENVLVRRHSR